VTIQGGDAAGYGFGILSEKNRPLVMLSFETRGDAQHARAEIARVVEMAIEITPQGWADRGAGVPPAPFGGARKKGTGG
jgi:hypothetical protein